ncbi:MAG: hypothetical protein K6F71_16665 [Ruminococcus sp.]|uniref:hypothetical protein n=1 Tax=Ruminococcus sp. TaxID=41978 RepID=UPI0025E4A899|nr:hypothetical protein [Ruminococcus sp.]MCR5542439.1 hypothetical protein [Ruminococcus sp.]
MGILEKLLNGEIDELSDGQAEKGMLRTVRFGGYDQKETLFAVNRLQDEIYALEQALNAKKLELPYTVPAETELAPIRHAMTGGFSEKDTNAYFDELFAKISDLRAELGEEASAKDE